MSALWALKKCNRVRSNVFNFLSNEPKNIIVLSKNDCFQYGVVFIKSLKNLNDIFYQMDYIW